VEYHHAILMGFDMSDFVAIPTSNRSWESYSDLSGSHDYI